MVRSTNCKSRVLRAPATTDSWEVLVPEMAVMRAVPELLCHILNEHPQAVATAGGCTNRGH
jgi:hypothetical protein